MSFTARSLVLGRGEGRTVDIPGQSYTYKAAGEDTGGAYALIEATLTGEGPPQHIHHAEEEAIYVVEGEVNVQVGDHTNRVTQGAFVLVPRGTVHTF